MGRPVPHIHGGEGHTCGQSASCGQEALGPVQAVRLCQRDWRFSTGEKCLKVNLLKRQYMIFQNISCWLHNFILSPDNRVEVEFQHINAFLCVWSSSLDA